MTVNTQLMRPSGVRMHDRFSGRATCMLDFLRRRINIRTRIHQPGGWVRRTALTLLGLAVVVPIVAASLADAGDLRYGFADAMVWLTCVLLILATGILLYGVYRMTGQPIAGWGAAITLAAAAYELPSAVVGVHHPLNPSLAGRSLSLLDLLIAAVLGVLLLQAYRGRELPARFGPLALGLGAGTAVALGRIGYYTAVGPPEVTTQNSPALLAGTLAVSLGMVFFLARLGDLSLATRRRIATITVLFAAGYLIYPSAEPGHVTAGAGVAAILAASMLLLVSGLGAFSRTLEEQRARVARLRARIESAEEDLMRGQELMHEVRSTVAGLNAASRLLLSPEAASLDGRRDRLAGMLESELHRLERLLQRSEQLESRVVDLDDVVRPLALAHGARGLVVSWSPTGTKVIGDSDALSESLNVLLNNASAHAAGSPVTVSVGEAVDRVELRVTDSGPGVSADLAQAIFVRGEHSATSSGQGLGLYVARRLLRGQGGDLILESTSGPGASFLATVPQVPQLT